MNLDALKKASRLRHKNNYEDYRYGNLEEEFQDTIKNYVKIFWEGKNSDFLENHTINYQDSEITLSQAVLTLRKEIRRLAHANSLGCTFLFQAEHYYISLLPCQIHVMIDKETGCFSITLPHFNPKQFFYYEWQAGLQWIQDYLNIDLLILEEKKQNLKAMMYINSKTAEIAMTSIRSLCEKQAEKLNAKYRVQSSWLMSNISFYREENTYEPDGIKDNNDYEFKEISKTELFHIVISHKSFVNDPSILINLLENPHDMIIENTVNCKIN